MTHPHTMIQSDDDESEADDEPNTRTVDVAVYYTTFDADDVSDETWETARDIRCFADPDDVTPETFDAYDRVAGGELSLSLSQLVDDEPSIGVVCGHIYSRLQSGRTDDELGYDGTEMRSAMLGDVIVVDGRASLVGEGCSFPDLGHIEWLTGERTVEHPDGNGGSGDDSTVDRGEGLRCDGGGMSAKNILENIGIDTDQLDAFDDSDESTTDDADRGTHAEPNTETVDNDERESKADDQADGDAEDDGDRRFPTVAELDSMRVDHGLSQREFSRRAGFEETRFSHIVSKNLNPKAETTQAFVAVLQETEPLTDADHATTRGPKPKPSDVVDRGDGIETDGGQPFIGPLEDARIGSSVIVTLADALTHNGVVYETARFVLEDRETVDLSYNPSTTAVSKLRVSGHIIERGNTDDGVIESWEVTSTKSRRGDWNAIEVCGYYYDREEGGYLDTETVGVASVTVATDCETVDRGEGVRTDGGEDATTHGKIDQAEAHKDRGLLEYDYASPCSVCGGVVFEWWDSETCRDCDDPDDRPSSEQTTLVTDGGQPRDETLRCGHDSNLRYAAEYCWRCAACDAIVAVWDDDDDERAQLDLEEFEQHRVMTDGGLNTTSKQSTLPSTDTRTLGAKLYSERVEGFGQKVHVAVYEQAVVVNPPSRFGDFEVYWPASPRVVGLYGLAALYWLRDQYDGCRDLLALRAKLGLCEVDRGEGVETDGGVERYDCDKCGETFDGIELIPVEIPLTDEIWDLCDPCVDDLKEWIESGDSQ